MEWMQRLRAQNRALHETAHALPFFHALWRHELPLESFVTQLRCLAVVHGAPEKFLAAHGLEEPVRALLDGHRHKLPLLPQDLELHRERWVPNVLPAVEGALRIADRILVLSQENTTALLGFFYTLEGSTQGGRVMELHLRKTFSLPEGEGTSFFCYYGEASSARWHNFLDVLGHSLIDDEAARATVIAASEELFRALIDVYRGLFPFQENQLGHHVVSLNPEAGQHPVPSNEKELEAACRAADRCWKAFPYFALRYGERGTRFAASDAALYEELMQVNNKLANLQRELAKKNRELARLNELKSQFLAMAAHDLNHPIGVIQMYGEFLLDEVASAMSSEHVEFLRIIVESSRTMQQILNDFLDIAKIEAGRLELHKSRVNLEALVRQCVTLNQLHASKKSIHIAFTGPEEDVMADVDPPKIEQVLNNLLSNAVKFSPPNTTVRVTLAEEDGHAVIRVSDQGPGIPRELIGRLFQSFERLRSKVPAQEKGSGLGLAIVKKIVQAHAGDVQVESREGRGSTFTVTLPMADRLLGQETSGGEQPEQNR